MSIQSPVLVVACAIGPLFAGCASTNALRLSIAERDAEIRDLRADKVALKEQLDKVSNDRDQLQITLAEASSPLDRIGEPQPATFRIDDEYSDLARDYGITTSVRGSEIVFSIPSAITFASGRAALSDTGEQALRTLAQRLKADFSTQARFHIEGHTDSDPIQKSKFASNRELSLARAMAVLNFIVVECQVDDERFVVVGHGQYEPIASNSSQEGKAQNRRVEIIVLE